MYVCMYICIQESNINVIKEVVDTALLGLQSLVPEKPTTADKYVYLAYRPTYLPSHLATYLYLSTYLPTYLPIYLT